MGTPGRPGPWPLRCAEAGSSRARVRREKRRDEKARWRLKGDGSEKFTFCFLDTFSFPFFIFNSSTLVKGRRDMSYPIHVILLYYLPIPHIPNPHESGNRAKVRRYDGQPSEFIIPIETVIGHANSRIGGEYKLRGERSPSFDALFLQHIRFPSAISLQRGSATRDL